VGVVEVHPEKEGVARTLFEPGARAVDDHLAAPLRHHAAQRPLIPGDVVVVDVEAAVQPEDRVEHRRSHECRRRVAPGAEPLSKGLAGVARQELAVVAYPVLMDLETRQDRRVRG